MLYKKETCHKSQSITIMNAQLRKAINVKGMLKRKSLKFKTQENIQKLKAQNNLVTSLKRNSIRWYLNENCKKNHGDDVKQTKPFWKTVGPFMSDNGKERDKIILNDGENVIVNTKDVCNVFNEYFINTANDMSKPDHSDIEGPLDDII